MAFPVITTTSKPSLSAFSLLQFPTPTVFPRSLFSSTQLLVLPPYYSNSSFLINHGGVFHTANSYNRFFFSKNPNIRLRKPLMVRSQLKLSFPLVSPDDHWGLWTVLLATGAFGLWSEKTKIGTMVSAALVSILVGLAASNLRIIPYEAPTYSIALEFLLPLTVPLLLFRANMRQLVKSSGRLLLAFLLGSVATVVGTLVAFFLVPMRSLGPDNWKIAAALMGSYIGGAVNYVAVSEALGVSPSIMAAGVAADNVICAIYFMVLFALASRVPPEAAKSTIDVETTSESKSEIKLHVLPTTSAIAVSFAICKSAACFAKLFGLQGAILPLATAIVVVLATLFPSIFSKLAPSAEVVSLVLMQIFFAVIGASGSIWNVINTAPSIFLFALVQVAVHLAIILGVGKLLHFELKLLLLASNANIGGPTTACGMATAKGWDALIIPGILAGTFGISYATFLGIGLGLTVLKCM